MTKWQLNMRQADWAEYLFWFQFMIMFWTGKSNRLADALSCQENMLESQKASWEKYCKQVILSPEQLAPEVWIKLFEAVQMSVLNNNLTVVNWILCENWKNSELEHYQKEACLEKKSCYTLAQDLLLHNNWLVVLKNEKHLHTNLLNEIYKPVLTTHSGQNKMCKLVITHYY